MTDLKMTAFLATLGHMYAGKARTVLNNHIRWDDRVMTSQAFIEAQVIRGYIPRIVQEDRIKPMSRMAYFRADNEEQRDHEAKIKKAGKKDVYRLEKEGSTFTVTMAELKYAEYLIAASTQ